MTRGYSSQPCTKTVLAPRPSREKSVLHIQPPQALVKLFITFKAYFSRYKLYLKPDDDATKGKTPHEVYHAITRDWDIDRNSIHAP